MAETYRLPKAVLEMAEGLDTPLAQAVRSQDIVTLETVIQIRSEWGSEWANNIIEKVLRDANLVYKEKRMAETNPLSDLNEELTELLADVFSFYLRAHSAHWNVVGTDFREYHDLFAAIYEDAYSSVDPIAENLRKLGSKAPSTLAEFISLRTLEETAPVSQDARILATEILGLNDQIINSVAEAFDCATEANQQGIANFLADRLDKHQMWKWQLSASLGIEAQNVTPVEPAEDVIEEPTETENPTGDQVNDMLEEQNMPPLPMRDADNADIEARKAAMATADRITMNAEVRAIDTEDGSLKIAGYAATFNQEADGLNFREVIAPGAFTRALDSADPVFLLVNHDMDGIPLASTQSGTLQLRQDANGLMIEAELDPANPKAQELTSALRRGDMDKMSFAFTVQPDGQTREAGLRTITEIDRLFEVSVVTLPAYSSTSVGMRSAADDELELAKRKLAIKVKQHSLRKGKA